MFSDQLALYQVEIEYVPDVWWSDSTNHIDFYMTAINLGNTDILGSQSDFTYHIEQYFSLDDELDASDQLQDVKEGDFQFEYHQDMAGKEMVKSPLLRGRLILIDASNQGF